MKIPLSVLMYRISDEYDYETVNLDVSSAYEGIKLYEVNEKGTDGRNYLYFISEEELEEIAAGAVQEGMAPAAAFICPCRGDHVESEVRNSGIAAVFIYSAVNFPYIFNRLQNIIEGFEKWEKMFHLGILKKRFMQDLIDMTEDIMTHPLIIMDNSCRVLGHTRDIAEVESGMQKIIDNGYASRDDLIRMRSIGIIKDFESTLSPEINRYENEAGEINYSIVHKFVAKGRIMGYSIAYHCLSEPEDGYLYLMEMVAERFQLYFEQERRNDNYFTESYQTFLSGILSGGITSQQQIRAQIGNIRNLDMDGFFILGQLKYNRLNDMSYSFISWSLHNSMPQLMPFVYHDNFYILKNNGNSENKTGFLTENEKKLFFRCFSNIDFYCGISRPFFSLTGLKNAAEQCRYALEFSNSEEKGNLKKNNSAAGSRSRMLRYDDVAFYHMVMELEKVMPKEMMESSGYLMLKKYEEKHGGDLCRVFLNYILSGRSVTETAQMMFMHRNTVQNKIKKAAGIMESDFDSFSEQVFYVISYMNDYIDF